MRLTRKQHHSEFLDRLLFHPVEWLLENLPVFQAGEFALEGGIDLSLLGVLGRLVDLVEHAKVAGKIRAGEYGKDEYMDMDEFEKKNPKDFLQLKKSLKQQMDLLKGNRNDKWKRLKKLKD